MFTATGTLPWWAPRHVRQLIAAALDTALALPPHELRALLRHWPARQEPHRRPRLEAGLQEVALQGVAAMKAAQVEALDGALQEALKPSEAAASDPTATARPTTPPPPPLALQLPKATPLPATGPTVPKAALPHRERR